MNFEELVPNIFYVDIADGLKIFVECLGFEIGYDEINSARPFCVGKVTPRISDAKTMSLYLMTAIQLFGKNWDSISHVLVSKEVEFGAPKFFY